MDWPIGRVEPKMKHVIRSFYKKARVRIGLLGVGLCISLKRALNLFGEP